MHLIFPSRGAYLTNTCGTMTYPFWMFFQRRYSAKICLQGLDLSAGPSCIKRCAGCGYFWSRRVFQPPGVFLEKRHQRTRQSRVTAPADLQVEPPKGVGFGFYGWVGLGRRARMKSATHVPHIVFYAGRSCTSATHVPHIVFYAGRSCT